MSTKKLTTLTDKQYQQMTEETDALVSQAKEHTIRSGVALERASEFLKSIKALQARVISTFKPIKQKMDAAKREVLDQEKLHMNPLKAAESEIKGRMSKYLEAEEEKRQKAIEAAAEPDASDEAIQVATKAVAKTAPKVSGVTHRPTYSFVIIDTAKLKPSFLIPDEQAIRKLVNSVGENAEDLLGKGSVRITKSIGIAAGSR